MISAQVSSAPTELARELLREPDALAGWLVLGDALAQADDPAGELILTCTRRPTGVMPQSWAAMATSARRLRALVVDAALLEPLFAHAARPEPQLLAFEGGGARPVVYEATHQGQRLRLTYERGVLSLAGAGREAAWTIGGPDDDEWDPATTNVYLSLLSGGLRQGTLATLELPARDALARHPELVARIHPRLPVPICAREHAHEEACRGERTMEAWAADPWRWLVRRFAASPD